MSFARPGQIVVSRSYYDVVSNLASEYAKLFTYEGSRTDKHVREHEIYVVGTTRGAQGQGQHEGPRSHEHQREARDLDGLAHRQLDGHLTIPNFAQDKKKLTVVAAVLAAVVAVLAYSCTKPGDATCRRWPRPRCR
jgi:hypothetical protein